MRFINISCRRLAREKVYAAVCILSLALGISGSLLISLYLYSELTFDHYHANHEHIYRVTTELSGTEIAQAGFEIGPLVVDNYPQFLEFVRFREADESRFDYGDNSREWENVFLTDPSVFEVFTVSAIQGDPATALADPYSIAISESMAAYYFAERDPIGETLSTDRFEFQVTLVFEDLPENVSHTYDALLPFDLVEIYRPDTTENFGDRFIFNFATFFLVTGAFDPDSMTAVSEELFQNFISDGFGSETGNNNLILTHHLQQLSELHFGRRLLADDSVGNITNLYIAAAVVVALLFSGCINYVNLATARVGNRTREVAIRKLVGADRRQLIMQFIAESVLIVGVAFLAGILLSVIVIQTGVMEEFTGKSELGNLLLTPVVLPILIFSWLLLGVLSGIYPAVKLAQPSMLSVMNSQRPVNRVLHLRTMLVWLQMTVAVATLASVFIMLRQSNYLLQAPLGFEKANRLVVQITGGDVIRGRQALINELRLHSEITNVVETSGAIGRSLSISIMEVEKGNGVSENLTMNSFSGGEGYLQTLGLEVIAGSSERFYQGSDESRPILVNETLVGEALWEQPVGREIGGREVVGVVRDFHYMPLHRPIGALILRPFNDSYLDNMSASEFDRATIDLVIEITGNDEQAVRTHIRDVVDQFSTQPIIEIRTLEAIWNDNYADDGRVINVVAVFAGLCIVIALIGLGGMAAYNNDRRSKEVAIRKVLGASLTNILTLLSTDMFKVLALAAIPACAGAWYLSSIWLQRFAYRISPNATPFILALLIVGLGSVMVMLMQTWRVARANPAERIKCE